MLPARKQPEPDAGVQDASDEVERVVAQIRGLNEELLAKGRELGLGFLDAYEQTLRTVADLQTKVGQRRMGQ